MSTSCVEGEACSATSPPAATLSNVSDCAILRSAQATKQTLCLCRDFWLQWRLPLCVCRLCSRCHGKHQDLSPPMKDSRLLRVCANCNLDKTVCAQQSSGINTCCAFATVEDTESMHKHFLSQQCIVGRVHDWRVTGCMITCAGPSADAV